MLARDVQSVVELVNSVTTVTASGRTSAGSRSRPRSVSDRCEREIVPAHQRLAVP